MDLDLDLYYIVYFLMKTASFWFGTIVLILAALLPDALGLVLSRAFIPSKIQIAQVCDIYFCIVPV